MFRYVTSAAFAAWVALAGSQVSAHAQTQTETTIVVTPPTLAEWSQRVFSELDRHLPVRSALGPMQAQTGIAAVKFNCSESGAPAGVELYKSSGSGQLDRATLRAVRQIVSLHPLPKGLGHDQKYIVRILFATSEESARRQIQAMRRDADESNAWYNRNSTNTAAIELAPVG